MSDLLDFLDNTYDEQFKAYIDQAKKKYGEVGVTVGDFLDNNKMKKEKDYVPFLRNLSREQLIELWNKTCEEVGENQDKIVDDELSQKQIEYGRRVTLFAQSIKNLKPLENIDYPTAIKVIRLFEKSFNCFAIDVMNTKD